MKQNKKIILLSNSRVKRHSHCDDRTQKGLQMSCYSAVCTVLLRKIVVNHSKTLPIRAKGDQCEIYEKQK